MAFKDVRERVGKSVLEVSLALKVSPQAVYQWERGETAPTRDKLLKLRELYNCTVDELLSIDN